MNSVSPYDTPNSMLVSEEKKKWFIRSAIFYFSVSILALGLSWFSIYQRSPNQEINYVADIIGVFVIPNIFVLPLFLALTLIRYPMVPGWYKNALKWSMFLCGIGLSFFSIIEFYIYANA